MACVCVSRPHFAGEEPQTAAGGRLRSQEAGESLFSSGGSHAEAQGLPAPCSFSGLYSTAPTTSLCATRHLDNRLCLLFQSGTKAR